MRSIYYIFFLTFSISIIFGCESESSKTRHAFNIHGTIEDAGGMRVFLDEYNPFDNSSSSLIDGDVKTDGTFELHTDKALSPSIYRLRIGTAVAYLVLDRETKNVEVNGSLKDFDQYNYNITGSESSERIIRFIQETMNGITPGEFANKIESEKDPIVAALLGQLVLKNNLEYVELFKKVLQDLKSDYPENQLTQDYAEYVNLMIAEKRKRELSQKINVGNIAPNIVSTSPSGKSLELENTRGKVVLLDFWASWCRPCRIANPHIVELYNKYKDQGFTVFSVSLDGLDPRIEARLGGDEEKINQLKNAQKERWIKAIDQDNLTWKWHVSDLKKWNSDAALMYGVTSIPKTFLISKDGKIAAINPRNNLEAEIKKLL